MNLSTFTAQRFAEIIETLESLKEEYTVYDDEESEIAWLQLSIQVLTGFQLLILKQEYKDRGYLEGVEIIEQEINKRK